MRQSIKDSFRKGERLVVGDRVQVLHRGQKYNGTVQACNYKLNEYVVMFYTRFSGEQVFAYRRRHQLDPIEDATVLEPEMVDYGEFDYEDEFLTSNMM